MTKFASIAAAAALTALFAGNAMAQVPASGEGPLFLNEAKAVSTVARDSVRNEAVAQRPASGVFDGQTVAQNNAGLTRAEVRAQAIANPPASGVFDGSTGFRTQSYWAQLIMIVCVTPLSFLFNRLWTFGESRVRSTAVASAGVTDDAAGAHADDGAAGRIES